MRITNETAAAAAYAQALSGVQSYPSASGTGRAHVQSGSFDQVDISQESSGESRFRKELAARLVQDVRASASTGSKGITYLVDSYERTDTDKAVTPKALNSVYKLVKDKADKSVSKAATLTAAGWSNGVQTLAVNVTATANGSLRIAQSATDEQFAAWGAAQPRVTAQAAGSLTVKAAGAVPAVDIPVEVVMV